MYDPIKMHRFFKDQNNMILHPKLLLIFRAFPHGVSVFHASVSLHKAMHISLYFYIFFII